METSPWRTGLAAVLACVVLLGAACTKTTNANSGTGDQGSSRAASTGQTTSSAKPPKNAASSQPSPDLSGTWTGTWANNTPDTAKGTFEVRWRQNGPDLSGTITIAGTPCLTGGRVSGTLRDGNSINFGVVSGQVEINYAGIVSGDKMSGRYATSCGKAEGDWEATRS